MARRNKQQVVARDESFAQQAQQKPPGFFQEFWQFLRYNKKWWLIPIMVALFLVMGLVLLSGTAVAPFIYTLF